MAPPPARARSSTSGSVASNRPRPISRASTTSLNTSNAHPIHSYSHAHELSQPPSRRPDHSELRRYTPEGIIIKSGQQLVNLNREYAIDPSLQDPTVGTRSMSVDRALDGHQGGMRPPLNQQYSFETKESHFPVNFNDEQAQDDAGVSEAKKKKGSASSIANDQELRKLFRENHHRDLKDVASEVLAHERGPRSEKTKQIFAMNW